MEQKPRPLSSPTPASLFDPSRAQEVRQRIQQAAGRSGRMSGDVSLLLATKTVPAVTLRQVVGSDLSGSLFGENSESELSQKTEELHDLNIEWHFIGHLQRNKINKVVPRIGSAVFGPRDTPDSAYWPGIK